VRPVAARAGAWLLLLAIPALPVAAGEAPVCSRVIAVGDLHGGFDNFALILKKTGLVDDGLNWAGGSSCLVQLGDIVDRGERSRELLDLLIRLEQQADGRMQVLVGNHEVMNVIGDLRYVHPAEFVAFADEETAEQRSRGFEAFEGVNAAFGLEEERLKKVFDETFPPGWFAHRRAFSPRGRYGAWLLKRGVVVQIDDTIYVHGGIGEAQARVGFQRINRSLAREVKQHLRLKDELIRAGWLSPLTPYDASLSIVQIFLEKVRTQNGSAPIMSVAEDYLELAMYGPATGPRGPLWNRDLALADEDEFAPGLTRLLMDVGARRIVVAHTTTQDGRIDSRFDNRVFVIDTGSGPAYGGRIAALEVSRDGGVRAIYPTTSEVLVKPQMTDARIEAFLREAEIVEIKEIGTGITRPMKATLALDGETRKAAFKSVDIHKPGLTRFESGAELNFSDSYRYERAAYLLDRHLGMNMVPVTVLRTIDGKQGALIDWVSDAFSEAERREKKLLPADPRRLIYQRAVMTVFDTLVANSDRNLANQLITNDDWKLHLIDHSRTFRIVKDLRAGFESAPISMPEVLVPRLAALDAKVLKVLLEGMVSKAQIKAMLGRRDKILAKLERDRKQYGDEMVLVRP